MALTRPRASQINTVITNVTDPLIVLNNGSTVANIDIGFVMNRNNGTLPNVALFWDESANTFVTSFTTSTGGTNANIAISSYANIKVGTFFGNIGGGSVLPNVYITGSLIPTANVAYDLGSPTRRFRDGYFSGNTIFIGSERMSVDENGHWSFTSRGNTVQISSTIDFNPPSANIAGVVKAGDFNFANGVSIVTTLSNFITSANAGIKGYIDAAVSTVSGNANVQFESLAALTSNAAVQAGDIATLFANAAAQAGAIVTANTAMKGYVDGQISSVNSAWQANAGAQAGDIATLFANAGAQSGSIATILANLGSVSGSLSTLTANAGSQAGDIATLYSNAAVQAGNIATIFANLGSVSGSLATLTANAGAQAGQIVTANTAMKGYVDAQITNLVNGAPATLDTLNELAAALANDANLSVTLTNKITNAEANITTANSAMKGYVDGQISSVTSAWQANAGAQAGDIATLFANAGAQSGSIATLTANAGAQSGSIATIFANLGAVSGSISTLTSNAAVQAGDIATLFANAGAQSGQIVTANTAMKAYVDAALATVSGNANVQFESLAALTSNAAVQAGEIANIYANLGSVSGSLATLTSNAAVQAGSISTIFANLGAVSGSLATLTANAGAQAGQIVTANTAMKGYVDSQITNLVNGAPATLDTLNELASALGNDANLSVTLTNKITNAEANITTANSAMKGYVDGQISTVNSNWQANAGAQAGSIATLTANAAAQAGDIATLFANAGAQSGAIVTANTALKGYVDNQISTVNSNWQANAGAQAGDIGTIFANLGAVSGSLATLTANAGAQAGQIVTANTAMKGYVDSQISNANTGLKGYVDGYITSATANANSQQTSINALNNAVSALSGDIVTLTSNAAVQAGNIATIFANLGGVSGSLATLTANAGAQAGSIATLTSNAGAQSASIADLYTVKANLASPSFTGNVNITGNLNVSGNFTVFNTNNISVSDGMIYLAENNSGNVIDLGFTVAWTDAVRYQHGGLVRDSSDGVWKLFSNVVAEPTTTVDFTNAIYSDLRIGNIYAEGYRWANGVSILTDVYSNLAAVSGSLSTLTANAEAQAGSIASLTSNAAVQAGDIANLWANAGAQSGQIVTANTAMKGYVDGQISSVTTAWQANTGAQAGSIASLTSNAAVQAGDIATLFANAGAQAGSIASLTSNAAAQAGSIATLNTTKANLSGAVFTGGVYATELWSTQSIGDEGGQLNLAPAATNTTISGNVVIDVYQNRLRIYESSGTNRGGYYDITTLSTGVGTNLAEGGGGGGGNTTPGGTNGQIQFNNSSTFGGASNLYYYSGNSVILASGGVASTSTTTGTFQVVGGAGITGNVHTGNLSVNSNLNYTSPNGGAIITAYMLNNGTLSFEGNVGQLFSITNSLTGTLFSVNDISGIPSIEVLDTGTIRLAEFSGNVGIGTASPSYKLEVNGSFAATTKSFVIDHPTKPDHKLRYGSLEGPENGVYVRGRCQGTTIELPDYWTALVDESTITVDLTPIGKHQKLYVKLIENNRVYIDTDNIFNATIDCFYTVWAERKDVESLQVEIKR